MGVSMASGVAVVMVSFLGKEQPAGGLGASIVSALTAA
jgi:hypothetical protein